MELTGKVAIVTGAAVRLGRALAIALAQSGAKIVVHYGRSADAAQETLAAIQAAGSEGVAVAADLSDPAAAAKIVAVAMDELGRADVLVNNASVFEHDSLAEATHEMWSRQFTINLQAPFFLSQAFARQLAVDQPAHIINIVDWRASRPGDDHLIYTMTKAGLATLTKSLALHLAPQVQVNAVAPGAILPATGSDPADFDALETRIPLRRTGTPDAVTDALLFLLRSDFVTGEIVHVTGGQDL